MAFEMKRVRAAGILLCGAVLAVVPVMAQQDATPPPAQGQEQGSPAGGRGGRGGMMDPQRRMEMMQKQLNLTDDQTTQIKGIFEESRGKMEELRGNTALSQEDRRAKMMEIREHQTAKVKAVLTPDQQKKFEVMEQRQRERMQEQRGGGGASPPTAPPAAQ